MKYKNVRLTREELLKAYADGERDFRYVDLSGVDLGEVNLTNVDLSNADLIEADLSYAFNTEAKTLHTILLLKQMGITI